MAPTRELHFAAIIVAATAAAFLFLTSARGAPPEQPQRAEEILAGMAKRLAESKTVKVKAIRELDPALVRETNMPQKATVDVAVLRPYHIRARSVAPTDVRLFVADGSRATVLDEKMNLYATVRAPGSIDDVSRELEKKFGFAPPLGELLSNDPEKSIRARTTAVRYQGQHTVDGHKCHKLLLQGEQADAELFVSARDELPRRLVVSFKDSPGSPKLRLSMSDWQMDAPIEASSFAFTPPQGAHEVEMVPLQALEPAAGQPTTQGRTSGARHRKGGTP